MVTERHTHAGRLIVTAILKGERSPS
jgi:hypothetical protein